MAYSPRSNEKKTTMKNDSIGVSFCISQVQKIQQYHNLSNQRMKDEVLQVHNEPMEIDTKVSIERWLTIIRNGQYRLLMSTSIHIDNHRTAMLEPVSWRLTLRLV